jgi:uncharacterized protein (TIGR03089 family)
MPDPRTPADLLRAAIDADPAAPLVTFYDDATGERVELSAKTFGNWVAKTANLLVDGLGAEPGDAVTLALPAHWQSAVWLFACWSAGLVAAPVEPGSDLHGDLLVVTEPDLATALNAGAPEIVGLSLHALGRPMGECPPGVIDYAAEVRGYGDRFVPYAAVQPEATALHVMSVTFSGADLVSETLSFIQRSGLTAPERVLTAVGYTTLHGVLSGLLGPLGAGGSVIITRNIDTALLERRITLEHVTAVAGLPGRDASSGSTHRLL